MSEEDAPNVLKMALKLRLREAGKQGGTGRTMLDVAADVRAKHIGYMAAYVSGGLDYV